MFFVFEFEVVVVSVVVAFVVAADVIAATDDKSSIPKPTQIIADFFPIIVIDPTIPFSPINEDILLLSLLSGFGYLFVGRAIPNGMTGINGSSRISTTDGNDDDEDDDTAAAESPVSVLGVCIDVIFVAVAVVILNVLCVVCYVLSSECRAFWVRLYNDVTKNEYSKTLNAFQSLRMSLSKISESVYPIYCM